MTRRPDLRRVLVAVPIEERLFMAWSIARIPAIPLADVDESGEGGPSPFR